MKRLRVFLISFASGKSNHSGSLVARCYYLLKIKGKAKIPDYVQLRDENFTLIGYFRPDRDEKLDKNLGNPEIAAKIRKLINEIPYGKIKKLEL